MINTSETEKYHACSKLLDDGKYVEAIKLAETLSTDGFRAGIFIDGGFSLDDVSRVRKGTRIFEQLLEEKDKPSFSKVSLIYNAANGHISIYTLKRRKGKASAPPNDENLKAAKRLYQQAINLLGDVDKAFASQVWINYGNCLSQSGRFIDAIECYQKASSIDPENGMAMGNLGIELEHAMKITGRFRHEYAALARNLFERTLGPQMHLRYGSLEAIRDFQKRLDIVNEFINAHQKPILLPQPVKIPRSSANQQKYIRFCVQNGLFLNAWAGDKELTPGINDDLAFGNITTSVEESSLVPELLKTLNEIKESFATARYLYFLSQTSDKSLDEISKLTTYYTSDFSINGVYIGLCKTSYSRAFDVLDKVARIVNIYFRTGNPRDSFWNIFVEKQSHYESGVHLPFYAARQSICEKNNPSMYALADLCIDYFENEKVDLKTIDNRRNKITHDYLDVKLYTSKKDENENTIDLDGFKRQTKDVLLLAKKAVLYVVSAINIAELQKERTNIRAMPITVESAKGQPFL